MATPITWRNVNAPSLAQASQPLEAAGRSFDRAFKSAKGIADDIDAVDKANWKQGSINNTNEFLNTMRQARTPEDFQAMEESGALQEILQRSGAQIDQDVVRKAWDGRLNILQGQQAGIQKSDLDTRNYDRSVIADDELDGVNTAKQFIAQGDFASANQAMSGLSEGAQAELSGLIKAAERNSVVEGHADQDQQNENTAARNASRLSGQRIKESEQNVASSLARDKINASREKRAVQSANEQAEANLYRQTRQKLVDSRNDTAFSEAQDDKDNDKAIREVLAGTSARREDSINAFNTEVGKLVHQMPGHIPKINLVRGRVDYYTLSKEQRLGLDALVKEAGLSSISSINNSDTLTAESIKKSLRVAGHTSARIAKFNGEIDNAVNTANLSSAKGADAALVTKAKQRQVVAQEELHKSFSPYIGESKEQDIQELRSIANIKSIKNLIDTSSGFDADEDAGPLMAWINKLSNEGIIVDGQKIIPPLSLVKQALAGAQGSFLFDSSRKDAAADILYKSLNSTDFRQALANRQKWQRNKASIKASSGKDNLTKSGKGKKSK